MSKSTTRNPAPAQTSRKRAPGAPVAGATAVREFAGVKVLAPHVRPAAMRVAQIRRAVREYLSRQAEAA